MFGVGYPSHRSIEQYRQPTRWETPGICGLGIIFASIAGRCLQGWGSRNKKVLSKPAEALKLEAAP
jgi:hypothetical protein